MSNSVQKGVYNTNRLVYIEPNEFASYYNLGNSDIDFRDLSWNPEDLAISVDLQVIIPNRSDKGQVNYSTTVNNVVMHTNGSSPIANYISYLSGVKFGEKDSDKSFLTDNYTNISFSEVKEGKYVDKESLGIDSIDINFDAHFFPIVTIKFTDVRGSSLFMPSEYSFDKSVGLDDGNKAEALQSFFSALFHFPYPRFLLSVKGFYGNRVTFQLAVSDFRSSMKSETGDYDITVQFIGYVYGLYTDLPLNLVMASPYYNEEYWQNKVADGTFKYVSSDGNSGGDILPYVEFITLAKEKNMNLESATDNENVRNFLIKKNKIKSLEKLANVHRRISEDKTGLNNTTIQKGVGDKCTFTYKISDNKFVLNDDLAKEYYDEIRDYLNTYDDGDKYLNQASNQYYNHLINGIKADDIKNDKKYEYFDKFKTFEGIGIENYFIVNSDGVITSVVEDKFKKDTEGDEELNKRYNSDAALVVNVKSGLVIKYKDYLDFLTTEIGKLKDELSKEENEIVEDLGSVFETIIGFSPTVENFYRMLFAHIDCFMNYFFGKVLDKITDDTREGKRTIDYLGVSIDSLDIPKTVTKGIDKNKAEVSVYPFPAYFLKKVNTNGTRMVATYPGESTSSNFRSIREVECIDEITKGVELAGEKIKEVIVNQNSENSSQQSGNTMISILSVLYNGVNPWSKISIDNSFDDEYNVLKILYYFAYQVVADKFIGMNTLNTQTRNGNKITMSDEYIDRQVDALLASGLDIRDNFITKLKNIKNINGDKRSEFLKSKNSEQFKLYKDKSALFSSLSDSTDIPLVLDETIMNKETLTNEEKKKYHVVKKGDVLNFVGSSGELDITNNKKVHYDTLKKWNSELLKINNAGEYLGSKVNLGGYCVSLLKETTDVYNLKDGGQIPFVSVNGNRIVYWVTPTDGEVITNVYNQNTGIYNTLSRYYNDDVKDRFIFFVGTKEKGITQLQDQNRIPLPSHDSYSARNIFSGVKEYYIKKLGKKEEQTIDYDDYKPLLQSKRCTYKDSKPAPAATEPYLAFATYFLSLLCEEGTLGKTLDIFNKRTFFTPIRKVDLLYLGGSLYFALRFTGKSKWNQDGGKKKIAELTFDGELGSGLLGDDYNKEKQKTYDISFFTDSNEQPTDLAQTLIDNFTDWCNYELQVYSDDEDSMMQKLSKTCDDNDDYFTLSGFMSNGEQKYTEVQGYTKTSECSKWLTDLVYSYEFIYGVQYGYSEVKNIGVDIDNEVWKFLTKLFDKLEEKEKNKKENTDNNNIVDEKDNGIDTKRALYYTLKNLYDKWLCGYCYDEFRLNSPDKDLELRKQRFCQSISETSKEKINTSEYNNFVYVDQFFNDISSLYMMDIDTIANNLIDIYTGNKNMDVYSFMSLMAEKNNLMLMALPVYNNMYNAKSIASVFTPNVLYSTNNYDNSNGIGTTYVVMNTSEVSHQSELYDGYEYCRDYPDIAEVALNKAPEDLSLFNISGGETPSKLNYNVSAFAVTYSKQNQMYFKRINVNMDNPKITDEAIRNTLMLSEAGSQGDTNQPITIGQNIYSIYSNRSYTCTVEMMGCANIMPLMYFQLNNVPMFRGLYMIINVKHSIKAGDMTTTFTGVRVSRYSLPDLSRAILNSSIFDKIEKSGIVKNGKPVKSCNDAECEERVPDQQLTAHFTLHQLIDSQKDKNTVKEKCDNTNLTLNNPNEREINNLKTLCENILEPLYEAWSVKTNGGTFKVTSGFRSSCVNSLVGSKETSDHRHGYAADLQAVSGGSQDAFKQFVKCWLWNNGTPRKFKQFIDETDGSTKWVHISYVDNYNKQEMVVYKNKKYTSLGRISSSNIGTCS